MAQAPTTVYAVNGPPLANMNVQFQPSPPTLPQVAAERANSLLQLYIIDYCEKHNFRDAAEALRREAQVQDSTRAPVDSKEGLLYEWWTCFWEVYTARVHPDRAHSKVAKAYSETLHQGKINSNRDPGLGSNQRLAGPSRPYVNGASGHPPPPSVNGHGAPVQYTNTPPGVQNGPGPLSGNSGATPTQLSNNPTLQHLQQQQQQQPPRPVNGRSFAGQGMPVGPQPGAPHPLPPGSQMQPRVMPNGNSAQTNPNLRQVTAQHSNSPQNQDPNSSPRNPNVSDNANARPESSDTPRGGRTARKRPNDEDSTTEKEGATPERKKQKRSTPENGAPLPSTPSLASAQPVGPGRPPPAGFFPPPNRLGPSPAGMPPMPPQPGPPGAMNAGPPTLNRAGSGIVTQFRELEAVHANRTSQTDQHQQHLQHMHEQTITAYKNTVGPPGSVPNPAFEAGGQPPRPTTVGPPYKGAMLPPPLPNSGQPPQIPGVTTPGGKPPVNGLLPPTQPGTKDGSPKIDGVSPENTRPASRPAPSTPQQVPSAPTPTGMISTPGGPTAPSPAQLATPQQISRPPTQSPGAPPSTVGMGATGSAATTPAALLARGPAPPPPVGGTMPGGFSAIPPANMLNGSIMAPSASLGGGGGGGPTGATMVNDSSSDSFLAFGDFDLQMMNFQEPFSNMGMNFDLTMTMDDFLQDGSLDSIPGTGTGA